MADWRPSMCFMLWKSGMLPSGRETFFTFPATLGEDR